MSTRLRAALNIICRRTTRRKQSIQRNVHVTPALRHAHWIARLPSTGGWQRRFNRHRDWRDRLCLDTAKLLFERLHPLAHLTEFLPQLLHFICLLRADHTHGQNRRDQYNRPLQKFLLHKKFLPKISGHASTRTHHIQKVKNNPIHTGRTYDESRLGRNGSGRATTGRN